MQKKLILISGSPCVGKTAAGTRLFESYDNSAYLDGDWCWCVHPFSVTDKRLRNGDRSMSFVLSNYLESDFEFVFFTSVVLTDAKIRENILNGITAKDYEIIGIRTGTDSNNVRSTLGRIKNGGLTEPEKKFFIELLVVFGCTVGALDRFPFLKTNHASAS